LIARGPVPAVKERNPLEELETFVAEHGGTVEPVVDDTLVEATRESLAKFCAGVGGPKNRRNHLFAAKAAIERMLKRS
jgi:hypothetical protein